MANPLEEPLVAAPAQQQAGRATGGLVDWSGCCASPECGQVLLALIAAAIAAVGGFIYWCVSQVPRWIGWKEEESDPKSGHTAPNLSSGRPNNSEAESAFAVSGAHFLDAHQTLGDIDSADGWTGDSGACYGTSNAIFSNQLRRVRETNTQVDATVRAQGEQVQKTRETLDNLMSGLQAAIPVAQALYFSGPVGPALSYNFQLSVATPAVGTATDATNTMQQDAQGHAKRLTELTQEYSNAVQAISSTDSAGALTSQFGAAMTVDPNYIKNLAPLHQQAADTFAAAGNTVRRSAEAISAAHGRVCDASKDALANAELAHNTLAAAMQQYSTGVAAALPAVANAYAGTDEQTANYLNRQFA